MEEINSKQKEAVRGLIESTFKIVNVWNDSDRSDSSFFQLSPIVRSSWRTSQLDKDVSRMAGINEGTTLVGLTIEGKDWPIIDQSELEEIPKNGCVWLTESQLIEVYRKADASDDQLSKLLAITATAQ